MGEPHSASPEGERGPTPPPPRAPPGDGPRKQKALQKKIRAKGGGEPPRTPKALHPRRLHKFLRESKSVSITVSKAPGMGRKDIKPNMYKICKNCGKGFITKNSHLKYCCDDCRIKAANGRRASQAVHEERICPECGKRFISRRANSVYCSRECVLAVSNRKRRKDPAPA
jgi:hypothetical protein